MQQNNDALHFLTQKLPNDFLKMYSSDMNASVQVQDAFCFNNYPTTETAAQLLPKTQLYQKYFTNLTTQHKFFHNLKVIVDFYYNFITQTHNLYFQRFTRYQICRSEVLRGQLLQMGFDIFKDQFKTLKFSNSEQELIAILKSAIHIAVCQSEYFEKNVDYFSTELGKELNQENCMNQV